MKAKTAPVTELLPLPSLQRLLAVMLIVIVPHLLHLAAWESVLAVALPLWRLLAASRHWPMPTWWLKLLLTLAVLAGVVATHGRIWGLQPGVALLTLMLALKLTELRARRDVVVTVFLLYFLLFTHFLYSQELWTLALLLLAMLAITALLVDVHHPGAARPLSMSLKKSAALLMQALPLTLLMFLLFPRLPGPLWSLPDDAGGGQSGLSDSMSPGDIARLALSDEIAFRVRFDAAEPEPAQRYWRGPLLSEFDGRSWHMSNEGRRFDPVQASLHGNRVDYEVTQEPSRAPWLFALDLLDRRQLPPQSSLNADYQLIATEASRDRRRYRLSSQLRYALQTDLPEPTRLRHLRLPARGNPQARALALQWRNRWGTDNTAIIESALRHFREQPYFYTLQPPRLGRDSIDDFLFGTRRGFCEHYAGSFSFLMRAAGIPARVVTGYLGGERNPFGDWMVIRQSDAHAWSEVWIAGRGWIRVDPTAAVSPARVEQNLSRALLDNQGELPDRLLAWTALRYQLEAARDWVDARWSGLVLAYGDQQQRDFLSQWGLGDWQAMLLALTGLITGALAIIGLLLARSGRPAPVDLAQRYWLQALSLLRKRGWIAHRGETPRDFAARVAQARPDLAPILDALVLAYQQLRYAEDRAAVQALKQALARLRSA